MRDIFDLRSAAKPLPESSSICCLAARQSICEIESSQKTASKELALECSRSARTNGNLITIPDRFSVLQARKATFDLRMPQSATIRFTTLASISKKCLDRDTTLL
jgi:hypothetical protein